LRIAFPISNLTQDLLGGTPSRRSSKTPEAWSRSTVILSNHYEFTNGTGDVESFDRSVQVGFDEPVPAPDALADAMLWTHEPYGNTAVETGTDMVFMLQGFRDRGVHNDNPRAPL
jgi:hypothetical protein